MKREQKIFGKPENPRRFLRLFYASLGALLVIDFFIPKHETFWWEGAPDFFAAFGFFSCVLLIFVAKILRIFIKRDENYYD